MPFNHMILLHDRLVLGAGLPTGVPASIWELQPSGWRKVGGGGGSSWSEGLTVSTTQWVYTLQEYRGHLVVGLATAETPGGAQVWIH
jgi:hypothetical protein